MDSQTHKRLRRGIIILASIIAAGIVGYMLIEGWSLSDAAYMTIITITTVGYGEVHPPQSRRPDFHHHPDNRRRQRGAIRPQRAGGVRHRGQVRHRPEEATDESEDREA